MLQARATYEATRAAFSWAIPEHYNIGVDACDKWADGSGRLADSQARALVPHAEGRAN